MSLQFVRSKTRSSAVTEDHVTLCISRSLVKLSVVAQLYEQLHLKRLEIGEWP